MDENTSSSNNGSPNARNSENATRYRVKLLKPMTTTVSAPSPRALLTCMLHVMTGLKRLSGEVGRRHGDVSIRNVFYVAEVNASPGFGVLSEFDSPPNEYLGQKNSESCAKEAVQGNNIIGGSTGVLPVD